MKLVFHRLPLEAACQRQEALVRSADRWSVVVLVVAILLWTWAQAPSFDIVPALVGFLVKIATLFTYGFFGPADSFVVSASRYVNLGYAIIFGPLLILILVVVWYHREQRALERSVWLAGHPALANDVQTVPRAVRLRELRSARGRHAAGIAVKGLIVFAACMALLVRYTDFRANPTLESPGLKGQPENVYCEPLRKIAGCECAKTWVDPWPGAKDRISWWLPVRNWCIGGGESPGRGLSNFRAVLPGSFYENQITEGKSSAETILMSLVPQLAPGEGAPKSVFIFDTPQNPYDTFPHVYPRPTMWANTVVTAFVLWFWVRLLWLYFPLRVAREDYGPKRIFAIWRRYRRFQQISP